MNNDIFDLYQELIIDHSRSPKNFGRLKDKTHHACGHNPLCGDTVDIHLLMQGETIMDIAWYGDGCAISKASASLMTESAKGKTVTHALKIFKAFHHMLTQGDGQAAELGKLAVFKGVKTFPSRVKCATLCWHTPNAALKKHPVKVTTE